MRAGWSTCSTPPARRGRGALERTPELLPVLQAGVVDAGGAGFVLFLDACSTWSTAGRCPSRAVGERRAVRRPARRTRRRRGHDTVGDLRYEVMYFLEAPDETIPAFKEVWAGIGDSIVVVGGDGMWNCHIHTDDIGAAIEAALDCGRPRNIRVTDLMEQVEEERWVREADAGAIDEGRRTREPVPTAVVAVATGDGIRRIFRARRAADRGRRPVDEPVDRRDPRSGRGGAADEVVVLPNNKNIIPVAEQVDELAAKHRAGRPDPGHRRGVRRADRVRPRGPADDNAASMAEAAAASWPARSPGPCATPRATPGRSPRATGSGWPATASGGRADARRSGDGLLDLTGRRRTRDRDDHRG